jgi:hypothetical protein
MADYKKRVPNNLAGKFFVDSTCINCDTCRQLAPDRKGFRELAAVVSLWGLLAA